MQCISISFKNTPEKIRNRFAFTNSEKELFISELNKLLKNPKCIILSTCNRCEIYVENPKNVFSILENLLKEKTKLSVRKCCDFNLKDKINPIKKENKKTNFENLKIAICGTKNFYEKLETIIKLKKAKPINWSFLDVIVNNNKLPNFKNYNRIVFTSQNGIEQFFLKLKKDCFVDKLKYNYMLGKNWKNADLFRLNP